MADATDADIASTINRYVTYAVAGSANWEESQQTRPGLIEAAFRSIQTDRQSGCLNDVVISSAEHYLFARFLVGNYFIMLAPVCALGFPAYDVIKAVLGNRIQASDCPTSEYDRHQTWWKMFGAMHGSRDYWHPRWIPPERVSP